MTVQLKTVLSLISGVVAGAWAMRLLAPLPKETTIEVYRDRQGAFKSKTKDQAVKLKRRQGIQWQIKETDPIPDDATIELRFWIDGQEDDGPLTDRRPNDKKSAKGDRWVLGTVKSNADLKTYKYCVFLVEGNVETKLEDPELTIEGKGH